MELYTLEHFVQEKVYHKMPQKASIYAPNFSNLHVLYIYMVYQTVRNKKTNGE